MAIFKSSSTDDAFSTLTEKDVDGSFNTRGVPNSSKSCWACTASSSFFFKNFVLGMDTFFFMRCMYMFILSAQICMELGSSTTGMPYICAILAATYVMFMGSVLARMNSASSLGILLMSTGKMNSAVCPMLSATSLILTRAMSCEELLNVFRSTKMPSLLKAFHPPVQKVLQHFRFILR